MDLKVNTPDLMFMIGEREVKIALLNMELDQKEKELKDLKERIKNLSGKLEA